MVAREKLVHIHTVRPDRLEPVSLVQQPLRYSAARYHRRFLHHCIMQHAAVVCQQTAVAKGWQRVQWLRASSRREKTTHQGGAHSGSTTCDRVAQACARASSPALLSVVVDPPPRSKLCQNGRQTQLEHSTAVPRRCVVDG